MGKKGEVRRGKTGSKEVCHHRSLPNTQLGIGARFFPSAGSGASARRRAALKPRNPLPILSLLATTKLPRVFPASRQRIPPDQSPTLSLSRFSGHFFFFFFCAFVNVSGRCRRAAILVILCAFRVPFFLTFAASGARGPSGRWLSLWGARNGVRALPACRCFPLCR